MKKEGVLSTKDKPPRYARPPYWSAQGREGKGVGGFRVDSSTCKPEARAEPSANQEKKHRGSRGEARLRNARRQNSKNAQKI